MAALDRVPDEILDLIIEHATTDLSWLWAVLRHVSSRLRRRTDAYFYARVLPDIAFGISRRFSAVHPIYDDPLTFDSYPTLFPRFGPTLDLAVHRREDDNVYLVPTTTRRSCGSACLRTALDPLWYSERPYSLCQMCSRDFGWMRRGNFNHLLNDFQFEFWFQSAPPRLYECPPPRLSLLHIRLPIVDHDDQGFVLKMKWKPLLNLIFEAQYELNLLFSSLNIRGRALAPAAMEPFDCLHRGNCGCKFRDKSPFKANLKQLVGDINLHISLRPWCRRSIANRQVLRRDAALFIWEEIRYYSKACKTCPVPILCESLIPLQPKVPGGRDINESYAETVESGWVSITPERKMKMTRQESFDPKIRVHPTLWYCGCLCCFRSCLFCFGGGGCRQGCCWRATWC